MTIANTTDIRSLGQSHEACEDAIDWAERECRDACEIWSKADDEKTIWIATREGVLTNQQLLTFCGWALVNTPLSKADDLRVRRCLDGSDRLTYPENCSRARWAACAIVARGRVPSGDLAATRAAHASQFRKICKQPFVASVAVDLPEVEVTK